MNISDCKGTSWQGINNASSHQRDVVENVDSEDDIYFDALDHFPQTTTPASEPEALGNSGNAPATSPVNALFGHMVDKILYSISLRLLSRLGGLEELHSELRTLAQSHGVLSARLRMLCELLSRYHQHVPEHYRPLLKNLSELARAGLSIYQLSATRLPTLCAEIRQFASQAEYLLSLGVVKEQLPATLLHQLSALPMQLRKVADVLLQARLMPEGTTPEEWLLVIQQHDILPKPLQHMLVSYTQLWTQLRALHESSRELASRFPLPTCSDWPERINWFLRLLNDPRVVRHIAAERPSALIDAVKLSTPLLRMVSQFPSEGTLAQQLEWARQNANAPTSELNPLLAQQPLSKFINALRQQVDSRVVNPTLFNALIILANPESPIREKSNRIISLCLRNFRFRAGVAYAMREAVRTFSGGSLALSTWDWYQQLPARLTWQQTMERFFTDLQREINTTPDLLRELLPDYVLQSAETLSALVELPVDQPWQDTLRWAIRKLGLSQVNDWLCQRYIELCLIRGIYESLLQGDALEREAILRDLTVNLKDYFAIRPHSELAGLVDLVPYLPLLSNLHDTIKQIPPTDSWLTWTTNLLAAIEQDPHPGLATLRREMETRIANYLSDSLVATFDYLWAQLPEFSDPLRFPEADAAVIPQAQVEENDGVVQKEESEFLLELFEIAQEYDKGNKSVWAKGDASPAKEIGVVAGLSAGWLASLYMFWRAYNPQAPQREIATGAEMQELQPQGVTTIPPTTAPAHGHKYIVPIALLSGMGATTAWVAWQNWGAEKTLTLQQVFRDILNDEYRDQAKHHEPALNTRATRVKRELSPGNNATRIAQNYNRPEPELGLSDINLRFKTWNISSNKIINKHISTFIKILNAENPPIKEETKIVSGAILFFMKILSNYVKNLHPPGNSSSSLSPTQFDADYFIYSLILLDKLISRINKIGPSVEINKRVSATIEYHTLCYFIENNLSANLYTKHATKNNIPEIIYDFMCNSVTFGFNQFPHLRDVMEGENKNLSFRNQIGLYAEDTYKKIEELISKELFKLDKTDDIITDKKSAFDFLIKKVNSLQQDDRYDVSLDEMEYMLIRGRDKIINIMLTSDYDGFIKNSQSIAFKTDVSFINSSKLLNYRKKWAKCSIDYMEIIKNNLPKTTTGNHGNLYSRAATSAINDLLNDRDEISTLLIENFTSPPDAYQQYALYIMLSLQINKIASFKQEWDKIMLYWRDLINDKEINSKVIALYNTKDDNISNFLKILKSTAIQKTFDEVEKIQSIEIRNDFYDALALDLSNRAITLKNEIDNYIKTGSYLLYQYMSKGTKKYKNADFSPESFYSIDRSMLEIKSVPLLTGSFFERNLHPLEQVQREAHGASITAKKLYRIYNDYIVSDSKKEAIITATNFFYLFGEQFISWESLIKTVKSTQEYKYIREISIKDSRVGHYPIKREYLGSAITIELEDSEKYLYTNMLGYPALINLDKKLTKKISATPKYEELYTHVYKALNIGDDLSFQAKMPFNDNITIAEILIEADKKNHSDSVIFKNVIIDDFHKRYTHAANELKNKGNQSIFDDLLSLIPFYSMLKRKIYDPQYQPVMADMVWDIIDVGAGLSFPGIKLANSAFHTFKKITRKTQKMLLKSDPTLRGTEKYIKTLQLSLPMVRKKIPRIQDAIVNTIEFSASLLNPIDPFILMGSKLAGLGDRAIIKISTRTRGAIPGDSNNISIKIPAKGMTITNPESKYFTGNPAYNYRYIDEITGIELDEMISRAPNKLYTDQILEKFVRIPQGQSDKACQQASNILQSQGYDTKIIGCLVYKFPSDTAPLTHYTVLANKADDKLLIDATFEQFVSLMDRKYKIRITSWEQWVRDITQSDKLKNNLIILKEYDNLTAAKYELSNVSSYNYLESSFVKDPDFHMVNIPKGFINDFAHTYSTDSHRVKNATTLSMLDSIDEKIDTQKTILLNLQDEEIKYVNKNIPVPNRIETTLTKTRRIIEELECVQRLPIRLSNYLYFSKVNLLTEHNKIIFNTPVSDEIASFLSTPEAISISEDITSPVMNSIQSIDEYGLATVSNIRYVINNGKLYKIYTGRAMARQTALIELDTSLICMNFIDYRWVIDHRSTIPGKAKTNALQKQLISGSTLPFRSKGILDVKSNTKILTPFTYVRRDNKFNMAITKEFAHSDLKGTLQGKIKSTTGNHLSSQTINGPIIGKWKLGELDENVEFIQISNGNSGCVAIKIAFDLLPEGKPVIVSAGNLSGCTMIYATDNHYFYAYHTGQQPGDTEWLTSQQGVRSIYNAHVLMKGTSVSGFETALLKNQDLPSIFSDYSSSLITYLGKNTKTTGSTRITSNLYTNVTTFDYNKYHTNQDQSRTALAYAVLSKNKGVVNISAYSEDLLINHANGDLTTLFSQHQRLNGIDSTINDSIFDTSVDTLSDLYTAFIGMRIISKTNKE
ncbi:Rho-activating domain of cytotoxic necrotizing factor [Cedecea davisae]|nr:cytotoxic necrotizing factor Rho-activating domain-containing protein [Cedecea davisae]SUX27599.1 Rho-activating domain of cytotoxic necrotizing factor [Cedecea davisae]